MALLHRQNLKILERYQRIRIAMGEREKNPTISVRCDRLAARLAVKEIILLLEDCKAQENFPQDARERLVDLETYVATHLVVVQDRTINPEILWSLISPGVGLLTGFLETLDVIKEDFPTILAPGRK